MATTSNFSPKAPDEDVIYTFDYSRALAADEILNTAIITCTINKGFDPHPEQMISGTNTVASPYVMQKIVGGRLNNIYNIRCLAATSYGQELEIIGVLTINE